MTTTVKTVTCKGCGWVHFTYTRVQAEHEVKTFNDYFDTLTPQKQMDWYGGKKSSITQYEHCFNCGGPYRNFRPAKPNDCPHGCTIQPIIHFDDGDNGFELGADNED